MAPNNWYKDARMGLFLHWGINTGNLHWAEHVPLYKTPAAFEEAFEAAGWQAKKWIDAARRLHASYVTLAIFHCYLGYIKAWRSTIPGTYTTKRDILGELIAEAERYGIKVVVYIGGQSEFHSFFPEAPWIDPQAYRDYIGDSTVDITRRADWQSRYARDVIGELMENYPKLAGFWFDGWNQDAICRDLFAYIHQKKPDILIFRNNFGTERLADEDVMSLESFGKVYDPAYDFASGCWTEPGGPRECCYTMPELSDWWHWYPAGTYDRNQLLRRMITITANGWVAKMGLGPEIGGDFPTPINQFIGDVAAYYAWAAESIFGTEPGGLPQGRCNAGAYVVTTHRQDTHYIHILEAPAADGLRLQDGGLQFAGAVNLKTGEPVAYTQENGTLYFPGDFSLGCQADADVVIRLQSVGSRVLETAAVPECGQALPAEGIIELARPAKLNGLIFYEKENAAIHNGGWASIDNNRLRDFRISVSVDGTNFKTIAAGTFPGNRGIKQIDFPFQEAKYLRVDWITCQDSKAGEVRLFSANTWRCAGYAGAVSYTQDPAGIEYALLPDGTLRINSGDVCLYRETAYRQIFCGKDGRVYAVDQNTDLYRLGAEKDRKICGQVHRADVDRDGTVWRIYQDTLYREEEPVWRQAADVAVRADGSVCCCGSGYIHIFDKNAVKHWDIPYNAVQITSGAGMYILDDQGRVFGIGADETDIYIIGNGMAAIESLPNGLLSGVLASSTGRLQVCRIKLLGAPAADGANR